MSSSPPAVKETFAAKPPSVARAVLRSPEGLTGVILGAILLVIIVFGPMFAPYPPDQIGAGLPLQLPSSEHLMGTDQLGRDVFSRWLNGGRSVILAPLASVAIALVLGGFFGLLAAYKGGAIDEVVTRIFDVFIILPPLVLVLVLIAGFGSTTPVLIITVALVFAPRMGRVIRGAAQGVVTSDYVASAQARGERTGAILFREILPNIAAPTIADTALRITYAIIFIATLNFLGLGLQPPASDWGLMVAEYRGFIAVQPWATIWPAVGIAALSVSFNLVADSISGHITKTGSHKS